MDKPLIVILGPTASGKTGYAVRLARLIDGEIICADSRTVYRGMDIGTAKPTAAEQNGVPHWGLDLVEPNQSFNLHDFMVYANSKIGEIRARGHVPMLVGGSCLYINGVIYHYELGGRMNTKYTQLDENTVVIGIDWPKNKLLVRSRQRSEQMLNDGLIEEYQCLLAQYGPVRPLQHNAYGVLSKFLPLTGRADELLDAMVTADWHLMKKQLTWWRNPKWSPDIMWQTLPALNKQLNDWAGRAGSGIVSQVLAEYKNYRNAKRSLASGLNH